MKNCFLSRALINGILVFSLPAAAAKAAPEQDNSVILPLPNNQQVVLSFSHNQLIAKISSHKSIVLANDIQQIPTYARDIWVDDFNFDGVQDVAATTRFDTTSSEQLYTIFIWDKGLSHFIPLNFKTRLSNLEIDPRRKEVRSSYQSGEFWVEDSYRFQHQQPYLYSKSKLITNGIWHTTIYNPAGQIVRSLVSDDGRVERPPYPVLLTVTSPQAPVYQHPLPSTRLPVQLNRGSVVTVLDFKNDPGQFYWVNITANVNQQIIHGWTLLSNLMQR